jgi:Zn-dependent hydrolases, including glyoxylases
MNKAWIRRSHILNIYEVNRVSDQFIVFGERLSESTINAMALVIGKKTAALIDTGMGITGDLDRFVRQFTDLPIIVLATHGDPDHIGAASLFENVYLSKLDDELLPWALKLKTRLGDLNVMTHENIQIYEYARTHIVGEKPFSYRNIENGDRYDLGDIILEAIAVPGHSKGSMCFLNRRDKYALTGDAISLFPWLWFKRSPAISDYIAALKRFREKAKGIEALYCGHGIFPLPMDIVDDLIVAGEEIVAGKIESDQPFKVPFDADTSGLKVMQHHHRKAAIIYDQNHIR